MAQFYRRTNFSSNQSDCLSSSNEMDYSDCTLGVDSGKPFREENSIENDYRKSIAGGPTYYDQNPKLCSNIWDVPSGHADYEYPPVSLFSEQSFRSENSGIATSSSFCDLTEFDEKSEDVECSVSDSCDHGNSMCDNEVTSRCDRGDSSDRLDDVNTHSNEQLFNAWLERILACHKVNYQSQTFSYDQVAHASFDQTRIQNDFELMQNVSNDRCTDNNLRQEFNRPKTQADPFAELGGGNCLTIADFMPSQYANDQNFVDSQTFAQSFVQESSQLDVLAFQTWLNHSN